jgi:hypothetical protein
MKPERVSSGAAWTRSDFIERLEWVPGFTIEVIGVNENTGLYNFRYSFGPSKDSQRVVREVFHSISTEIKTVEDKNLR